MISSHIERLRYLIHSEDAHPVEYLRACWDASLAGCLDEVLEYFDGQPRLSPWAPGWRVVVEGLRANDELGLVHRALRIIEILQTMPTALYGGDLERRAARQTLARHAPGIRCLAAYHGDRFHFEALGQWGAVAPEGQWLLRSTWYELREAEMSDRVRARYRAGDATTDELCARLLLPVDQDAVPYLIDWLRRGDLVAASSKAKHGEAARKKREAKEIERKAELLWSGLEKLREACLPTTDVWSLRDAAQVLCEDLGVEQSAAAKRVMDERGGPHVEVWRGVRWSLWWSIGRGCWSTSRPETALDVPHAAVSSLSLIKLWRTP